MAVDAFEERRKNDPQGLINDLVGQTTRQAKEIHRLTEENKLLKTKVPEPLAMEVFTEKPKRGRKKIVDTSKVLPAIPDVSETLPKIEAPPWEEANAP